jgi:hypothetical protein
MTLTPTMFRRLALALVLALAALTLCAAQGHAQEEPQWTEEADSLDWAADSTGFFMDMMGPTFGIMMEQMMDALIRVLEQPETADRLATFARNYYDALVEKGFTEDQALRLVIAIGFPALSGGG